MPRAMIPLPLALVLLVVAEAQPAARFAHGVASGDPHSDSIVLWTRVTPQLPAGQPTGALAFDVRWAVRDRSESTVVRSGLARADAAADFTIKLVCDGLAHSTAYSYSFSVGAVTSAVGHFRLPPPRSEPLGSLRYAIFSCSNWAWGFFNAYRAVADAAQVDFWVHLGDWQYQDGQEADAYPNAQQAVRWSGMKPTHETVSLDDYRQRHALTREDADLQACMHPRLY